MSVPQHRERPFTETWSRQTLKSLFFHPPAFRRNGTQANMGRSEALLSLQQRSSTKLSRKWFIPAVIWQANNSSNQPICQALPLIGAKYEDGSSTCVDFLVPITFEGSAQGSRRPAIGLEEAVLEQTPSTHQKGCAFLHLFAFAHIFTLPAIFPPKQTCGDSYPSFCVCSNVFSSTVSPHRTSLFPFFGYCALHAFLYHCIHEST